MGFETFTAEQRKEMGRKAGLTRARNRQLRLEREAMGILEDPKPRKKYTNKLSSEKLKEVNLLRGRKSAATKRSHEYIADKMDRLARRRKENAKLRPWEKERVKHVMFED